MAQQGFVYEENAYKALQQFHISTGGTAGASHDKPDLTIQKISLKQKSGCELKISTTAAGSLVMKYTDGVWSYGETKGDPEKVFLMDLGEQFNLLTEMNHSGTFGAKWRGKIPHLQNDARGKKILVDAANKSEAYQKDLKQFGATNEVHIPVKAKAICDYYNAKNCDYINVGTHGFYLLNKRDPLDLNKKLVPNIPDFADIAAARIRVRCQYKGSGDYQFVMTLEFSKMNKSYYNIAPIMSANNVTINMLAYQQNYNQKLIEAFA
jgi:hypothetical protein